MYLHVFHAHRYGLPPSIHIHMKIHLRIAVYLSCCVPVVVYTWYSGYVRIQGGVIKPLIWSSSYLYAVFHALQRSAVVPCDVTFADVV